MRTHVIGDVHGCAAPLAALLGRLGHRPGTDRLLLTGDLLTRGPDPAGAFRLAREARAEMVMGNHDLYVLQQLDRSAAGAPPSGGPEKQRDLERIAPLADALLPWLRTLPYAIDEPGFLLVHAGIRPDRGLRGTSLRELTVLRTWPPTGGIEGPRWHAAIAPLPDRPIVFGHDAPGGLVVKRRDGGRPWLVGLDSGCVYGGPLTGWVLEEDRIVQVPGNA